MAKAIIQTISFYQELVSTSKILSEAAKSLKKLAQTLKKTSQIDPSQAWYWTPEWQAAERQADRDIKAGRLVELSSADDLDKPFEELFGKK